MAPPGSKGSFAAKLQDKHVSTAETTHPSAYKYHNSSQSTSTAAAKAELEERTFEIAIGGSTDASIFFDKHHAIEVEHQAFEKLYGLR